MTKEELKSLISSSELSAVVSDIIAYIVKNRKEVDAAADGLTGKVTTLIGSDANKSVRTIANEELAKQLIPENAKEALDTLGEIAAWIQQHPDDASAMNTRITNLTNLVGTLPEDTDATTVIGFITAEIAALKSEIEGKNVSASGETGDGALVEASATNNAVSVNATQKLKDAVAAAETALQLSDFATIGNTAAKKIVSDAITAAEAPAGD